MLENKRELVKVREVKKDRQIKNEHRTVYNKTEEPVASVLGDTNRKHA